MQSPGDTNVSPGDFYTPNVQFHKMLKVYSLPIQEDNTILIELNILCIQKGAEICRKNPNGFLRFIS